MAGWFGSPSTTVVTMIVTSTPSTDLALTNIAYCSPSDLQNFAVPGSKLFLANIADAFVLSISPHESLRNDYIALNTIHRRLAKVSNGDTVSVSRFIPPENFNLALLRLELEFVKKGTKNEQVDAVLLANQLRKRFMNQVMTAGQKVTFEYHGNNYIFTINQAQLERQETSNAPERGMISSDTYFIFEAQNSSGIKIVNQREAASSNIFRHKEFNLQSLGIGGLSAEFADIFRRAFASRVFPPHVTNKLGIKHVKGMLLYGPPGTGKTLMARQIGKMLNGKEPKIVNGPEVLSKFVGETEKNVRDLFADAESDQRTRGDDSDLHVIIFDEIDAICKSRGSTRDGTGVHDSIVNQLLTKIDGVESLNNVLLIGMTNRKDLLDEALLRPGRLEVQVEISLPDENGRLQILQIHTNKMKENSFLAPDVNLKELAARTKNYSGAELEGVVKSAVSFALNRQVSMDDLTKPVDEENIKVTMDDFLNALLEIIPAFGASTDDLERCRLNGMVDCGDRHKHIYQRAMLLVEQVKVSKGSPLVTCLLEGPSGSGKTALAATVGIDSDFPYVKIISAESMIGLHESTKCAQIVKVFEDAYKSPLSIWADTLNDRRCEINAACRSKVKLTHNQGSRAFVASRYSMRKDDQEPNRMEFFKATHYSEEKGWSTPEAQLAYEKMVELESTPTEEGTQAKSIDVIVDEVLGTRSGYIKGLGYGPKPTKNSSKENVLELKDNLKKTQDELQDYKSKFGFVESQIEAMKNALLAAGIQVPIPQFSVSGDTNSQSTQSPSTQELD